LGYVLSASQRSRMSLFVRAREDERQMGALTEAGCALGAGGRCI
jgi:hypothetical protein